MDLELVATCALGLETLVAGELDELGVRAIAPGRGAVHFRGGWRDVVRANLHLRAANRVLVTLASWPAAHGDALAHGAGALVRDARRSWAGITAGELFAPSNSLAVRASASRSQITDVRWIALRLKDGIVDAQRKRFGQRASVSREDPVLPLRLHLDQDHATLLLDTSGQSLDHRGYRVTTARAPVREQLAAACVLAADWQGQGPVVDPMCGSGTLLVEAGWRALGRPPSFLRRTWAFERFPGFDPRALVAVRSEAQTVHAPDPVLIGIDRDATAVQAARDNLTAAQLDLHARISRGDAFTFEPPKTPGLVLINPAYGRRLEAARDDMKRLGDLLKQRYKGWRAVVLAGDPGRGKYLGLRPKRKISIKNGPVDARILVFDLF